MQQPEFYIWDEYIYYGIDKEGLMEDPPDLCLGIKTEEIQDQDDVLRVLNRLSKIFQYSDQENITIELENRNLSVFVDGGDDPLSRLYRSNHKFIIEFLFSDDAWIIENYLSLSCRQDIHNVWCDCQKYLEKDETMMETTRGTMIKEMKESAKSLGGAASMGAKLAMVGQINEVVLDHMQEAMIKVGFDSEFASDPKIRKFIGFFAPGLIHLMATAFENKIPYTNVAKAYAELAMVENTRQGSAEIMMFLMEMFKDIKNIEGEFSHKEIDYDSKNVTQLRKIAKEKNLALPKGSKKDDIIDLMREHDLRISVGI